MAKSDVALWKLVGGIVAGDADGVSRVLAASPPLATVCFHAGATRQAAKTYFLDQIGRYVYAGDTALHIAAAAYQTEIVRKLIAAGAKVHARNRRGAEPLHSAAVGNPGSNGWNPSAQAATIVCLIQAGADPNAVDKSGVTALHRAVRTRCGAAVRTLLECGADPARKNNDGSTPMLLANHNTGRGGTGSPEAKSQQQEILRLFERCVVLWICFLAFSGTVVAQGQTPSEVISTYCVPCHNARLAEARFALDSLDSARPWAQPDTWERVLRQLRARTMPPADNPRPDPKTYETLISALATALDRGDPQKPVGAAPQRVTDLELAARLAKLLWNGTPDAILLDIARKDQLNLPAALETQVRRMLADAKIAGLVDGFFDDWLGLNQSATMEADAAAFPEFDAQLRKDLQQETKLFLESQLRQDRPAMELWTAEYTFVNDRLARHYGIRDVSRPQFRRVTLQGTERAGLLGQGSFLTATSVLTRHAAVDAPSTSPAARGKWIRMHFLGVSVPHPIPNIPPLQKGILLSAQLRTLPDPSCTSCHSNFFPMGYALENFDPLGRWRTEAESESGNVSIDASGALVDGTEFTGPAELRYVLLERQDAFLTTITERLLAYAVSGKAGIFEPTPERMPAVRAVLREAERKNFTWSGLITAMASSGVFQAK